MSSVGSGQENCLPSSVSSFDTWEEAVEYVLAVDCAMEALNSLPAKILRRRGASAGRAEPARARFLWEVLNLGGRVGWGKVLFLLMTFPFLTNEVFTGFNIPELTLSLSSGM